MTPNRNDPVIDEVREIRHRISERFDHDAERLVAYYMELQEKYRDRILDTKKDSNHQERDQILPSWDAETLVRKTCERKPPTEKETA